MQKYLVLRAAKLSSETQKIKSTNNICVSYEHSPVDPEERKHGVLFAVIGVQGDSKKSEELIELILETFHGEYYQDLEKSPLQSFETALAKINEELGEFTNSGNTFWMGKINAVLAAYAENTLHLTQAGNAEGFLYRASRKSDITKDLKGDTTNPLRTFINIASGEMTEGDKVAILSSGILSSASTAELSDFVMKYHPKVAISNLASLITGVGGSHGQNGAIVIEFMTPETLSNETLEDEPDEIWLEAKKTEKVSDLGLKGAAKFLKILATIYQRTKLFISNSFFPFIRKLLVKGKGYYQEKAQAKDNSHPVIVETQESIFEPMAAVEPEKPVTYKSEIRIKEGEDFPKLTVARQKQDGAFGKVIALWNQFLGFLARQSRRKKPNFIHKIKKVYFLYAGIVIVLILIPFIFISRNNQTATGNKNEDQAKLEQLNRGLSDAIAAASSDKQKAISLLTDLSKQYETLKDSKHFAEQANSRLAEIAAQIDRISNTQHPSLAVFSDLSFSEQNLIGLYKIDTNFYAVGEMGDIFNISSEGKATQIQTIGEITGNIIAAISLPKIRTIEILTDTPNVYEFDLDTNEITARVATDGWEEAIAISSYETNLYLLSKNEGKIYKHTRTVSGYSKGASYVGDETQLTSPTSLTIDSDIYIIDDSGQVMKFTAGTKQEFTISSLPFSLTGFSSIYTTADTNNLFFFGEEGIVLTDKTGAYKAKYMSSEIADATCLYIENSQLYFVSGKKVYSFEIK